MKKSELKNLIKEIITEEYSLDSNLEDRMQVLLRSYDKIKPFVDSISVKEHGEQLGKIKKLVSEAAILISELTYDLIKQKEN